MLKRFFRLAQIYYAYRNGFVTLRYQPIRLWIEPTNKCNLKCIMCPHGQEEVNFEKGFMDIGLFRKIINEVTHLRADVNLFLGGESLLHPKLIEMVKYMRQKGVTARIYTNATLLTPTITEELVRSGLDHITFSFDGMHKRTYENYRKGANFEKTLKNIRQFLAAKKELGQKKPVTVIQCLQFNETADNPELEKQFRELFDQGAVDRFTFIKPHSFGGVCKNYSMQKDHNSYAPCAFLWYSMSVMWDGTVVPCCLDMLKKYPIGNIKETSLGDLWNSEKLSYIREKIYCAAYKDIELCSACDILWKKTILGVPFKNYYNLFDMIRSHL